MPLQKHLRWPFFTSLLLTLCIESHASTLSKVIKRGDINCGVYPDDPSRSAISIQGNWEGFYVDFCRAVAAAVLQNPDYVNFVEVRAKTRFTSLVDRTTDVVMYSSTWTLGREDTYAISFPAIYLFDAQAILVRKNSGIKSLKDLNNKSICVTNNTTSQRNLENIIAIRKLNTEVIYSKSDPFFRGSACDAYTGDKMNLLISLANHTVRKQDYTLLPSRLSREPISPTVRNDDVQWHHIIRAVIHATILAEEKGVTASNADHLREHSNDLEVTNLLGSTGNIGEMLGLDKDWGYRVIKSVGNYAEIFDRNLGENSPVQADRGLSALWKDGGTLFSPPFK
ncbi:amino acid ABC transporter substrate-binding protein [Marinomonas pollencensis]|uniref:General L-amino acid transport system substrate-binding protein n=1 Tax=Marinomonas pollencensis TaxID=491954 RepID=A0A3E0DFA6_9GAMM|nr:amino acid ABC transporter substrate-binding protein [Marinomonas pollencensis]REG81314.1 general L-amino acid transport system substrate-binding protein [Marinomonas pollencensis]